MRAYLRRHRRVVVPLASVLVAAGAVLFILSMLVFAGPSRVLQILAAGLIAGGGVALHTLSAEPDSRRARRREDFDTLLAVFFTFGSLGPLIMMVIGGQSATLPSGLLAVVVSGLIAVGWASAFTFRAVWLIPVVVAAQVVLPSKIFEYAGEAGLLNDPLDLPVRTRLGLLATLSISCVVVGFVLVARLAGRIERGRARAEAELATAAEIHRQLVPDFTRELHGWSVAGRAIPSETMGGDLLAVFERPDGFDAVVADVTGHGVRAGVVMALVKGVFAAELTRDVPLHDAADAINRAVCALTDDGTFVTAALLRVHPGGRVELVNAGHPPVFCLRAGAPTARGESTGLPLGVMPGETYACRGFDLAPGDRLVAYSDGITEAMDQSGGMLGVDAVGRAVEPLRDPAPDALFDLARAHAGGEGPADDQTVLELRRVTPDQASPDQASPVGG